MTEQTRTRIPAPLYAAAGVGDLAYEQLRKLPALYAATRRAAGSSRTELRERAVTNATELREKAVTNATELRGKVQASTAELRERAMAGTIELREKTAATVKAANSTATELRDRAATRRSRELDVERWRELAKRNTAAFLAGAHAAQERAVAVYELLVARGERMIGGGVLEVADTVKADIETTEAELAGETAAKQPARRTGGARPAKAPAKAARPAKRTRSTRGTR